MNSRRSIAIVLVLVQLALGVSEALGGCWIEYTTHPNSSNEWAAHMTAIDDGTDDNYTIQWFVRGSFTNNQWVDYTWWATGSRKEYLTVEQHYGLCFEVYFVVQVNDANTNPVCTTSQQTICYYQPR
jgi:hypothetical protein